MAETEVLGAEYTSDVPTRPRRGALLAELTREVGELETLPRFDRDGAGERAPRALAVAQQLGLPELALRAQLVRAEVLQRRGDLAQGGRLAQEVLSGATEHDCRHLVARGHHVLQAVLMDLGDLSRALEHAVRAVDSIGATAGAELPGPHPALLLGRADGLLHQARRRGRDRVVSGD